MKYTIAAHATKYNGVIFRSRLEARWAAFFDLCGYEWQYEPVDLPGWTPDFRLKFPCNRSDCTDYHTLFVEVKPYDRTEDFNNHPCMQWSYGCRLDPATGREVRLGVSGCAGFGINPEVTAMEIAHGDGGGVFDIGYFVGHLTTERWKEAGNLVQWKGTPPPVAEPPAKPVFLGSKPPMDWLRQAAAAGRSALATGVALWFKHGLQKSQAIPIRVDTALRKSMGLTNDQARRGIHALEKAGLLKVQVGGRGRCAHVTLINTQLAPPNGNLA